MINMVALRSPRTKRAALRRHKVAGVRLERRARAFRIARIEKGPTQMAQRAGAFFPVLVAFSSGKQMRFDIDHAEMVLGDGSFTAALGRRLAREGVPMGALAAYLREVGVSALQ
jgi:hypothetical protein